MSKKQLAILYIFILCVIGYCNTYTMRSIDSVPYIPAGDNSMFVLVGNSLAKSSSETLIMMLDEALKLPELEVRLGYGNTKMILNENEKKALAMAILRLVLKDSLGFPQSVEQGLAQSDESKKNAVRNRFPRVC